MRVVLSVGVLSLVSGCYVGPVLNVKEKKQTCAEPYLAWTGGLTYHVEQGTGDGDFDYTHEHPHIDRVNGTYDLKTGVFWYRVFYEPASYHTEDYASGVGNLWNDGDMDLEYELFQINTDDTKETWQVRHQRFGCNEKYRFDEAGDIWYRDGTYTGGAFEYTEEWVDRGVVVTSTGTLSSDSSWVESASVVSGPLTMSYDEEGSGMGYVLRNFSDQYLGTLVAGFYERFQDGSFHANYNYQPAGSQTTWDYTVDAAGNGAGTETFDGGSCELVFTADACQRTNCSDGNNGACTPPWSPPSPFR